MSSHEQVADELEESLSEEDRGFLDELADGVARRHMIAPTLFFLESVKPLGFVTSQFFHFLRPMVQLVWSEPERFDQLTRLLERRGSIELLLRRLEERA